MEGVEIKLCIDPQIKPVQQPVRRIPVALEDKVAAKLDEALRRDIIESVTSPSRWISPIVLAFKENGDIRLCVDMRLANKAIRREMYPLPTFESFMTKLKGARFFSRLDLKDAYHQLELDEDSREITTFITPMGLFRYKRLMFGVNSAPEIFQRHLEQLLVDFRNVMNYIDDVIIFGESQEEHDKTVRDVCKVFRENNVLLNDQKCVWKSKKLKFLGHILSDRGIEVDPDKVDAIKAFREPINKEEIRSFLGLVTETEYSILHIIENSIPKSMTISEIAKDSVKDEEIIDAMACVENDEWKSESPKQFYPFRYELSTIGPLLLRGNRIVIPTSLRNRILELAHEGHPGESAMKRRNVSHVKKIPITTSEATASVISPLGNARDNRTSVQDYQEDGENKEHRTERLAESLHQPLKLKLVNKGGMWESAQSSEIAKESDDASIGHER
ncbi:uncharacterized protein K02A2.6-like [Drosophila nasuta]|uniref:uncharacterized protein K02A2.6-like n=1 Tax=Drosophila nasuta TaxID=42062 RepID=UPI00295E9F39|nr:uncharacterized protein K02A2.6-like [Drosophila nasuta]